MDRYADIKDSLIRMAEEEIAIKAIIAIGSSVREEVGADEYSDLDLMILTEEPAEWYSGAYPNRLGKVSISFLEPTLGGGKERRCIYDADRDVDMMIFTPEQFETALNAGVAGWVMNRGYQVLHDRNQYEARIRRCVTLGHSCPELSEDAFDNLVNDFYFHNIWAYKKLKSGELWAAKMCVDAYLKNHLLKAIELYCYAVERKDVWHDGRFIDRWAGDEITKEFPKCFAHYDKQEIKAALVATNQLFERVSRAYAAEKGYAYSEQAANCANEYLKS